VRRVDYKPQLGATTGKISDPIQILKGEHHTTLQWLEMIERMLQYLESLPRNTARARIEDEQSRLKDCVVSLEQSITQHFEKEEGALFPVLAEYIGREEGPIEVMLHEHRHIRSVFQKWREGVIRLARAEGLERESLLKEVSFCGYEAIRLLRLHISKENQILFEVCEVSLSFDEKRQVTQKLQSAGEGR